MRRVEFGVSGGAEAVLSPCDFGLSNGYQLLIFVRLDSALEACPSVSSS
jgi:hypothetical protein